jgi:hypothetical protein
MEKQEEDGLAALVLTSGGVPQCTSWGGGHCGDPSLMR